MDKVYEDTGVEQGRSVLRDLAARPSTAKHVATKLVRYFIADEPPPELVERLAKAFRDTSGDLKEVTKALVASPEAWALPCTKLKRPSEWVVSMVRSTGIAQVDAVRFTAGQGLLGEPLWRPPSPKGYADDEATWIDRVVMVFAVAGFSIPGFVLAYILIFTFSIGLDWLPVQGYTSIKDGFGPCRGIVRVPNLG